MTYANTALCVNTHIQTIQTQVLQASISNITNLKKVGLYSLYMRIWGKSLSDGVLTSEFLAMADGLSESPKVADATSHQSRLSQTGDALIPVGEHPPSLGPCSALPSTGLKERGIELFIGFAKGAIT